MPITTAPPLLTEREWHARRDVHRARMRRWTRPHRQRRARGQKHPVMDFLFDYYSNRPGRLERWHPGTGVVLAGDSAHEYLDHPGYIQVTDGVMVDPAAFAAARRRTAEFILAILTAAQGRTPKLACFALHEWAMVYRTAPANIRHVGWPLRLGHAGTDAVAESLSVRCSHFDAVRYFPTAALPLNVLHPTHDTRTDWEQPGCLHTNMDLYRWCYTLDPFVPSELTADAFELAVRLRELDMRASPYDLRALGYQPVRIETPEGRAEFAELQSSLAAEAAPLRDRLADVCRELLESPSV